MVDSLTDSFSSIVGLPDQLHSKYASLHISSRAKLSPRKDQECNSEAIINALKALQEKLRQLELQKDVTSWKLEQLKDLSQGAGLIPPATPLREARQLQQSPKSPSVNKSTPALNRHKTEIKSDRVAGLLTPTLPPAETWPPQQSPISQSEFISDRVAGVFTPTLSPAETWPPQQSPKNPSIYKSASVTSRHRCTSASGAAAAANTSVVVKGKGDHHLSVGRGKHYHLNYKDLPFIIGVSATPSHSLFANYQHMLHLLKCHGPMCRLPARNYEHLLMDLMSKQYKTLVKLSSLLTNLQDEVQKLSSEYQYLSSKRSQCDDHLTRKEHQLKMMANKLRSKSNEVAEFCRQSVSSRAKCPICMCDLDIQDTSALQQKRHLLKVFKQVQKTLQRDDLHWQ